MLWRVIADSPFLLYAKKYQIRSLELDASVSTTSRASLFQPVVTTQKIISLDFDSREGYVYWVERWTNGRPNEPEV